MYTIREGFIQNMGAAGNQEINVQQLAVQTWNYLKDKGFKIPIIEKDLNIGMLVPNQYESALISILASRLDKFVSGQLGTNSTNIENVSAALSLELIENLYTQLLQAYGVGKSVIDNTEAGDFSNLEYIPLYALSTQGPLMGAGRGFIQEELRKKIKNGFIDVLEAAGLYTPETEQAKGGNTKGAVYYSNLVHKLIDEKMEGKDLSVYSSPEDAKRGFKDFGLQNEVWVWGMRRFGQNGLTANNNLWWNFLITQAAERYWQILEQYFNFQRDWELTVQGGRQSKEGRPWRPAGQLTPGGGGDLPLMPILVTAAIAGFFYMKNK